MNDAQEYFAAEESKSIENQARRIVELEKKWPGSAKITFERMAGMDRMERVRQLARTIWRGKNGK